MDKKKAVKLEQMEAEMARLWEQSQNETDNKKKQKLIQSRNKLQWKAAAMRSGRKLSKQTRDDLVAYSFIAPNFIGFAVFTLIPIIFAFILAFTEWDGNNRTMSAVHYMKSMHISCRNVITSGLEKSFRSLRHKQMRN